MLSIPPPIMTNQLLTSISLVKYCGAINDVNNNSHIVTNSNQIFGQDDNENSVVNFDVGIIIDHMKGDQ